MATIYDHGEVVVTKDNADRQRKLFEPYSEISREDRHTTVKPGDEIPIKGIDVEVLSRWQADHKTVPSAGAPNPLWRKT